MLGTLTIRNMARHGDLSSDNDQNIIKCDEYSDLSKNKISILKFILAKRI
jgi:hypothetical protein